MTQDRVESNPAESEISVSPLAKVEEAEGDACEDNDSQVASISHSPGFRPFQSLFALGIFMVLSGGIWFAVKQFGEMAMADTEQGTMDHGGMSHDEMMAVDGAFNAIPVQVEEIRPGLVQETIQYTGSVYPYLEVTVYPRVAGQLRDYSIYPGDRVTKGQVIAQLDALERRTELVEAKAERDVMREILVANSMQLEEQQREIDRMAAELDYMKLKAKRFKALAAGGAISQNDYDLVASEVAAKESAISGAKTKWVRMKAELGRDRAKINQFQAKANTAVVMERYTNLTAPISGIVQSRMADPGVVVQPGMGVLKIGDYSRVRLRANVAQADAVGIGKGTRVKALIPGTKMPPITGEITSIFPSADPRTRTVTVEAVVNNPSDQLLSGQFLEMQIIKASKPATLSVPQTALHQFQGQPAVWVVQGNGEEAVAVRRRVKRGLVSGDRVEIVKGLKSGDHVITTGTSRLLEDSKVAVVNAAGEPVASLSTPTAGNVSIQLVRPKTKTVKAGTEELILQVVDADTLSPLAIKQLEVDVTMPMKNMAPMTAMVDLKALPEPGKFRVKTHFGMKGDWVIKAQVKDAEHLGRAQFKLTAQ
ncbi:efflux RND transporter periplasmic adaptor subunit [Acaryochloris sp. CCMEE 5410]|uniref:efflux RND transporter periplasmic adaptor subunit n=1 Tax=Acaryochloris sp. CCMEE 5410 TaxID=310037 RepID=UPI00024843EB|nr:efflux RND transporter periplasmic adaptor subunit [Acaryochloris sp. CCMEE 5410]KAI9129919.1 efflux RND transporter periplasmic adaptor subunit [Acaryochloris sp. CCMEE 5410]